MTTIFGTTGDDIKYGTSNQDYFYLDAGNDIAYGGDGFDYMYGFGGNDTLNGEAGTDNLYGGDGDDLLVAGTATNLFTTSYLYGEGGNDTIYAELDGYNWIDGGTGNDLIYASSFRPDFIYGGDGFDTVSYHFRGADMRIDLGFGQARNMSQTTVVEDRLNGIENAIGSRGNDVIVGSDGSNRLEGDDGDDVMFGNGGFNVFRDGAGKDTIYGGANNDYWYAQFGDNQFYGGTGFDSVSYKSHFLRTPHITYEQVFSTIDIINSSGAFVSRDHVYDIEGVTGTAGTDRFYLNGRGGMSIDGDLGYDVVNYYRSATGVTASLDPTYAGVTTDKLNGIEEVRGSYFGDVIRGGPGADYIYGDFGADILSGGANGDLIIGWLGTDVITGGLGRDVLYGDQAPNMLIGNVFVDKFVYNSVAESQNSSTSRDVIMDFQPRFDKIYVANIDANWSTPGVNDAFKLDTNGVFTAGEIRQIDLGSSMLLVFFVDNVAGGDMAIELRDVSSPLAASDFVL